MNNQPILSLSLSLSTILCSILPTKFSLSLRNPRYDNDPTVIPIFETVYKFLYYKFFVNPIPRLFIARTRENPRINSNQNCFERERDNHPMSRPSRVPFCPPGWLDLATRWWGAIRRGGNSARNARFLLARANWKLFRALQVRQLNARNVVWTTLSPLKPCSKFFQRTRPSTKIPPQRNDRGEPRNMLIAEKWRGRWIRIAENL